MCVYVILYEWPPQFNNDRLVHACFLESFISTFITICLYATNISMQKTLEHNKYMNCIVI